MSAAPAICLNWVFWWLLSATAYAGLLFGVDALLVARRRRRQDRQTVRRQLARIDREAAASVHRIGAAFALAQQLLRDEAVASRNGH